MSLSRSPRHDAIRRREEAEDARRVRAFIGAILFLIAFAYVAAIVVWGWPK